MRTLIIPILLVLLLAAMFGGCDIDEQSSSAESISTITDIPTTSNQKSTVPPSPSRAALTTKPSDTPVTVEPSEITSPSGQETVAIDFIAAQNAQDWSNFTNLWAERAKIFYSDFFGYTGNAEKQNGYFSIQTASLIGIKEIENFAQLLADYQLYLLPFDIRNDLVLDASLYEAEQVSMLIVKTSYQLEKEFWDYREGINYRVFIIIQDEGLWRVAQDYQGYPDAAEYFEDNVQPEESVICTDSDNELSDAVDGTLHYTNSMSGYFIEVYWGDYTHVSIKTIEGETKWFWFSNTCETDPETLEVYQKVKATWENRDIYIDEAGEVMNLDVITKMTIIE